MAATPAWKVYNELGEYLDACKYPEHAAAVIAAFGKDGWTIRYGHKKIVWTEGKDGSAAESYDAVAEKAYALTE